MTTDSIMKRLEPVFKRVDQQLMVNLKSEVPYISKVCEYTLLSGGKRLRPVLFILASRLCGYKGEKNYQYSIIFEYLHAASLLHDDVIDVADTRRGQAAAQVVYGNQSVILVGDFLVSRATSLAIETELIKFIKVLSDTAAELTEGQVLELLHVRDVELSESDYEGIIYRKTGALIQAACGLGAVYTGASPEYEEGLSQFGRKIGQAFQMIDDFLDYSTTAFEFGKPVGHDLDEGKITLPVILALARHLVHEAKQSLDIFPDSQEKRDLCDLADFIVSRRN
ncbi:MAG: polyprenyl synthetase family protein [Deltaproteobacteria bacterium]|nr:polyprenyl synthetase family protein [Deltaproteobacteria bacterium]